MVEETGRSVVSKQGVERLDVRVDRQLEGRIGGPVGWGVPEEFLTAERVVLVIPRGIGSFGRHLRLL